VTRLSTEFVDAIPPLFSLAALSFDLRCARLERIRSERAFARQSRLSTMSAILRPIVCIAMVGEARGGPGPSLPKSSSRAARSGPGARLPQSGTNSSLVSKERHREDIHRATVKFDLAEQGGASPMGRVRCDDIATGAGVHCRWRLVPRKT